MKTAYIRAALIALIGLTGCAVVTVPPKAAGDAASPNPIVYGQEAEEVLSLLSYYQRMLGLSGDEQRKELALVSQAYARDKRETDRLKLAMLMGLPNTSLRDEPKLIALLEGAPSRITPADSPRRNLIALLLRQAQERNRLANQISQVTKCAIARASWQTRPRRKRTSWKRRRRSRSASPRNYNKSSTP